MYSLGIILFEICYPLKTAMERADILGKLRQVSCILPPVFEEPEKSLQAEIISSLVKHQVTERPHSVELLRSGKVPVPVEDESVRAAVQGILDVASPYHDKLLNALFTRKQADELATEQYKYDIMAFSSTPKATDLLLQQHVKERITDVFRQHGAVEAPRPILLPNSRFYDSSVVLLDPSGSLVQLRNDLILPNARLIAMKPPVIRKSFAFGEVYRAGLIGSYPRTSGEVDFDIVSFDNLDLALREAEVVKVVDEILDSFPSLSQAKLCYHFGHSLLLDSILSFCDIPNDKWYRVKEVLSKLHIQKWTWAAIREELRAPGVAVASTSLDELQRFDWRDTYDKAIPKLRAILQNTDGLESTFTHLEAVITYLARFMVKRKIYINPLSSVNEKFYRGHFLFQCLFDTHKRSVLAGGGRYDKLIQQHRQNSKIEDRHAVGFNLAWERIMSQTLKLTGKSAKSFLKKGEDQPQDLPIPRRCEAIVDSPDPAALRTTGIKIIQCLWANHISAELSIDVNLSKSTGVQKEEDVEGHCWVILIKQDDTLTVRNLVKNEQTDMRSSDLVSWLQSEIRERDKIDGRHANRSHPPRHLHHSESTGNSIDREPDVRVLVSQNKSKKSNRRNIIEDAYARSQDLVQGFLDGPIIAIETKDELFEGLRATRLSESETWRRFIQNAPATDRTYLSDLHSLLQDVAGEVKATHKGCFIYNFRSKACLHYDLWKAT
jgi:translation initiation factor 2-alpha kinase 4